MSSETGSEMSPDTFGCLMVLMVIAVICIPLFVRNCSSPAPSPYEIQLDNLKAHCAAEKGVFVYNGKGSPAYLCFGKDGRLIGHLK